MAPPQKPGKSKQDYGTPREFIQAIERQFHVDMWQRDLAAHQGNAICERWYGPGGLTEDSFKADWTIQGDLWLNSPFSNIEPWAFRCRDAVPRRQGRIFQLTPASIGTDWYRETVHGKGHIIGLSPRITFVGETTPYPKDLMLIVWSAIKGGFSTWRWK